MSDEANSAPVRRGRPPDPDVEASLRRAARAELSERGWHGVTADRIAERAGVSRTTIYRRRGSLQGVLILALDDLHEQTPVPDTGSLRGDVEMLMAEVLAVWSDPANVAFLKALIAAQLEDGELGAAYHELTLRRRAIVVTMIDRAVDRGEVRSGVPTNMFYDIVLGAILQRMVLFGEPIDDAFIQALTLTILDGLLA